MQHDFLTVFQFAELLQVHPNTIRNMVRSGRLNAFKVGGGKTSSWRICRTEIHRMAEIDLKEIIDDIVQKKIRSCSK